MFNYNLTCFSSSLGQDMHIQLYGTAGVPLLAFPYQGCQCDNFGSHGMIDAIAGLIETGQVQVYCVDSIDKETFCAQGRPLDERAQRQESFVHYITDEVLPLIEDTKSSTHLPLAVGIDLGATNAAGVFLRRPDLFCGLMGLSGSYDAAFYTGGQLSDAWRANSPLHILGDLRSDASRVELLRHREIALCTGQGAWEEECIRTTRMMGDLLATSRIDAWIDVWGADVFHDYSWWSRQLVYFLPYFLKNLSARTDT